MLTTILNHNEAINNYILELNSPYSSALKNHMINLVSGITHTHGIMSMLRMNEYFMLSLKSPVHRKMIMLDF